jgi:parallel beta-helix repeat protein
VLFVYGAISPTIEGLCLTGGNASLLGGGSSVDCGGGACVIDAGPTFSEIVVISNTAGYTGFGGGIYFFNSPDVMLTGSTIRQNTAFHGGGLYFYQSPGATLIVNDISENEANRLGSGQKHHGGILFSLSPGAVLIENTITGNRAADQGGGVSLGGSGNALLRGNIIRDNSCGSPGFEVNSNGGGLLVIDSDGVRLMGNTIANNRTQGHGGGIYEQRSEMVLINNIIADNEVFATDWFTGRGSGLYLAGDSPRLLHNTIALNSGGDGSGIYVTDILDSFCTAELTNTIVATHSVGISVTAGSTAIVDGVLWWDNDENTRGDGQITVTHAYTGNPRFVDPDAANYHIGPGSAAIDRGVLSDVDTDIDGHSRLGFSGLPDLGADEFRCFLYLPLVAKNMPHR